MEWCLRSTLTPFAFPPLQVLPQKRGKDTIVLDWKRLLDEGVLTWADFEAEYLTPRP